jgi:hypothetical protein
MRCEIPCLKCEIWLKLDNSFCDVASRVGAWPVIWMNSLLQCLHLASTD